MRFAFVDVWPDAEVIIRQNLELATSAFGKLQDIFTKFAPDDALTLLRRVRVAQPASVA